jgi:hypothetical protein
VLRGCTTLRLNVVAVTVAKVLFCTRMAAAWSRVKSTNAASARIEHASQGQSRCLACMAGSMRGYMARLARMLRFL